MNRYARWVHAHGGWLRAPHPDRRQPDYNSLNYRICRRAAMMQSGYTLRQAVNAERAHPVRVRPDR